jgi:hypothetical protein
MSKMGHFWGGGRTIELSRKSNPCAGCPYKKTIPCRDEIPPPKISVIKQNGSCNILVHNVQFYVTNLTISMTITIVVVLLFNPLFLSSMSPHFPFRRQRFIHDVQMSVSTLSLSSIPSCAADIFFHIGLLHTWNM